MSKEVKFSFLNNWADECEKRGSWEEGVIALSRAVINTDDVEKKSKLYFRIGECYNSLRSYDKAVEFYKKSIDFELSDNTAYVALAKVYEKLAEGQYSPRVKINNLTVSLNNYITASSYNATNDEGPYSASINKIKEQIEKIEADLSPRMEGSYSEKYKRKEYNSLGSPRNSPRESPRRFVIYTAINSEGNNR
jgi:tetratricopeptide (TPR) repeat protein